MSPKDDELPKITTSNTKKEMLEAFNKLKEKLTTQAQTQLKPEKTKEEREQKQAVQVADALTTNKVITAINSLKQDIGKGLADIADKLEEETERYNNIKKAISAKEKELKEIFEIEKSAFALAALLEAQNQKKVEFEAEMSERKAFLEEQINQTKTAWEKEKAEYADSLKDQKKEDEKLKKRQQEEYEYNFSREKEQKINSLTDKINQLEKELANKKEEFDKQIQAKEGEIKERELAITEREKIMDDLQAKVDGFPAELDLATKKAVQKVTDRLTAEAAKSEELLASGFDGEKNVFKARIDSLEKVAAVQKKQLETLSAQIENAYGKVQDIAIKAVAGSQTPNIIQAAPKVSVAEQDKT